MENLYVVIYVYYCLNRRTSGGEGRKVLPTNVWWQFPAILSAPAVELIVLSCSTGK